MSLATLQEFLDRVDAKLLFELTLDNAVTVPPTDEELLIRNAKLQTALDDAGTVILGYKPRIDPDRWPAADLQRTHCVKIALQCLSERRVGGDYKSIIAARDAVIAFYDGLVTASEASGSDVTFDTPERVFNDDSLKGLIS